jgi:YHS domain-containing protein
MTRAIILVVLIIVLYQAVKTVFRAANRAYHRDEGSPRLPGQEMVQDPQCRTYIVKDRAVARRSEGMTVYFCSKACADKYEKRHRN